METRKQNIVTPALFAIAIALFGCGDDEEKGPSAPSINLDASVGADSSTPVIPGDAGVSTPDSATPSGDCRGANGCYSCKPATSLQYLNSCATGCRPFDNKRLPGYTGTLPPL